MAAPKSSFGLLGCVSAIDSNGRTIWIADAHRDDGKRARGWKADRVLGTRDNHGNQITQEWLAIVRGAGVQPLFLNPTEQAI